MATNGHAPAVAGRTRRQPAVVKRLAIVAGLVLFLAVSGLLARFLSVENDERDKDLALLQAQIRGDPGGMLAQLSGCSASAACVAVVRSDADRLRRPGA